MNFWRSIYDDKFKNETLYKKNSIYTHLLLIFNTILMTKKCKIAFVNKHSIWKRTRGKYITTTEIELNV